MLVSISGVKKPKFQKIQFPSNKFNITPKQ